MEQQPRHAVSSTVGLASFGAITAAAAALGGVASARGTGAWYRSLRKPPFTPPDWVFAPAWTALYAAMAASAYRVWRFGRGRERARALAWWGAQLGLNVAWSWLFFAKHRKRAALIDLVALEAFIGTYASAARKVDRPAAWLMAPYLGWVTFAGLLNEEIVRRNP